MEACGGGGKGGEAAAGHAPPSPPGAEQGLLQLMGHESARRLWRAAAKRAGYAALSRQF